MNEDEARKLFVDWMRVQFAAGTDLSTNDAKEYCNPIVSGMWVGFVGALVVTGKVEL